MTTAERLVTLETKLENIESKLDKLADKFDAMVPTYATKAELDFALKAIRATKVRDTIIQILVTSPVAGLIGFFIASVTN